MTGQPASTGQSPAPLEYRIAIADAAGADEFRDTVLKSASNTDGAIYYRKRHLQTIANHIDVSQTATLTAPQLRTAIRSRIARAHASSAEQPASTSGSPAHAREAAADGGSRQMRLGQPNKRFLKEELCRCRR
jgi:hypothetical protein